jgi:hypothetical protein
MSLSVLSFVDPEQRVRHRSHDIDRRRVADLLAIGGQAFPKNDRPHLRAHWPGTEEAITTWAAVKALPAQT